MIYSFAMRVDVVERAPNVRDLLGLIPVGNGIATTSRHFIYPLTGSKERDVPSNTLLYSEGEEATRAILLLSGVAIVTLPSPNTAELINWEFVTAPALIAEEALSKETHLGWAKAFTRCRLQVVYVSNIWEVYTNPTDTRTLHLAQANRTIGRRPWAGLIGEAAPGRIDFLLNYLEALTAESKIPYLRQDDFASSIGISRETFNKELKNPQRRQLFDKIAENFLPRDRRHPIFSI